MRHHPHSVSPSKSRVRIALIYKAFAAVSHVGLGVCAMNCQRVLRAAGYECDVWACNSAAQITAKLEAANAKAHATGGHPVSHVVISAPWVATPDVQALIMRFDDTEFAVISHSNFGFLAADPNAIRLLRDGASIADGTHNFRVGGNCEKFTSAWDRMYGVGEMLLLPNLYDTSAIRHVGQRRAWHPGQTLRVGVFGATRPLKNMVTAVAAAIELGRDLSTDVEIWMNSGRNEGGGVVQTAINQLVAGLPTVKLVHSGWQAWPDFRHTVGHMHVLLSPSYTESFCICAADGIAAGVASVVSEAIEWLPDHWVANVDNVADVARVARYLLHDVHAVDEGQHALRHYVRHGLHHWEKYLRTA